MGRSVATGSAILCSTLEAMGVEVVFGLPGSQSIELFDDLRRSSIRTILTVDERAATFMESCRNCATSSEIGDHLPNLGLLFRDPDPFSERRLARLNRNADLAAQLDSIRCQRVLDPPRVEWIQARHPALEGRRDPCGPVGRFRSTGGRGKEPGPAAKHTGDPGDIRARRLAVDHLGICYLADRLHRPDRGFLDRQMARQITRPDRTAQESLHNPRARSAVLRIGERIA